MAISQKPTASYFRSLSMLALFLSFSFCTLLLTATDGYAATRYVKPQGEAPVRRGQGNEYKILAMVKEGVSVELLEENEGYSRVRLANGIEGWILKRFLSVEPPPIELVAVLRKENEEMKRQEISSTQKIEELSTTLSGARTELDALIAERDEIRLDYETLQRDTADVIKIKNDLEQTAQENIQLVEKLAKLEEENSRLKKDKSINWFLAGGGILLAGILLGRMPSPTRKRRSSLLS